MGWTTDKREHARRLAICETCPTWRMQVTGFCLACKRPFNEALSDGPELESQARCRCGGAIKVLTAFERCGTGKKQPNGKRLGCGCPLATRKYANCPQGKW